MQHRALFVALALASSLAQSADNPYAGHESRPIKALSGQDIADYRNGRGMRTSLAAELNHYPGPRHVLEHAQALGLSEEQQTKTQQLYDAMARNAARLGAQIVQKETELEALFAGDQADRESIRKLVQEIAGLQADFRFEHLAAHLEMKQLMSPRQVADYDRLRGYLRPGTNHDQDSHRHEMMHGKTLQE